MSELDLISLAFIGGLSIPVVLYMVYWFAVDSMKRYVDREIREAKL